MQACNKNIIECLRESGINPTATSRTYDSDSENATKAIDYTTTNNFHSSDKTQTELWMIDFHKDITLGSYAITTNADGCYWIRKWKALISTDNINWKVVDTPPEAYAKGENHTLNPSTKARYFKIESLNGNCGYRIAFKYIYFYGSISKLKSLICTCIHKRSINFNFVRIIVMLCS